MSIVLSQEKDEQTFEKEEIEEKNVAFRRKSGDGWLQGCKGRKTEKADLFPERKGLSFSNFRPFNGPVRKSLTKMKII